MSTRDEDLAQLREALELDDLDETSRDAFANMLRVLLHIQGDELSPKQRAWLHTKLGVETYANLASKNGTQAPRAVKHNHRELAECLSTCPGWTPPALRNLPKKPPVRRP